MPQRSDVVEVIPVDDGVTIRLPCRSLNDPSFVRQRFRAAKAWDPFLVAGLVVGIVALSFAFPFQKIVLSTLGPIVIFTAVMANRVRRLNLAAVDRQQTQVENEIQSDRLLIRERTPYRDRWFYRMFWPTTKQLNPLEVGRLRIERTEVKIANPRFSADTGTGVELEPVLWTLLNGIEYSLIADDHDGRALSVLAHAYPRDVLAEAARQLKRQLDGYRIAYDRQLAEYRPGIKLPDYGDGIPICQGPRLREPKQKPKRPEGSEATIKKEGLDVVISTPRGPQMEAIEFRANLRGLTVTRTLLLGEIEHRIESQHLRKVYVRFEELTDSDDVRLIIEYYDPKTQSSQTLDLLNHLSTAEVCWVAAEIRQACPPTGDREDETVESRFQYSIAQLLYATTLLCVFFACASSITPWGWIFGIQAVAIILCLTSFTGIRLLAPYTNRSWTLGEIILAIVIGVSLSIAWLTAYAAGA